MNINVMMLSSIPKLFQKKNQKMQKKLFLNTFLLNIFNISLIM